MKVKTPSRSWMLLTSRSRCWNLF